MLPDILNRPSNWAIGLSIASLVAACSPANNPSVPAPLNSRNTDEQPALSGNARLLGFVSNRNGKQQILVYDLQRRQFVNLPRLNVGNAIAEKPSLSYTGRYIVYVSSDQGRPEVKLYDRVTQSSQNVTSGYRAWIRNPNISPDGRYITFESSSRGQWDIEVLDRGPNIELDIPDGKPSPRK